MNVHDSEKMAGIFSGKGLEETGGTDNADVIVLNTCSIREKAEQKFYSELGRLKKAKQENPNLKIAVAGCIAQQQGNTIFKRFPYVDFILGPDNIDSLESWIGDRKQSAEHRTQTTALKYNPGYHTKTLPIKREGRVRAWVSIMYGCDNFCAYCVVPYTRGRERSRPRADIYNEFELLAEQGFKEITLLGQNVNSYGKNLAEDSDFPGLLEKIHKIDGIQRIRFVTSHPRDLSGKLINAMRDLPKVCEHLHLPVQSGSDKILHLMNRGYTFEDYKKKMDSLRNNINNIAITTDIIVGFPGESDKDFELTLNALLEIEYDGIFAFKYSKRPGTKALNLPDHIDEAVKSERLSKVLQLQEAITFQKNKALIGKTMEILVEGASANDPEKLTGRTKTNKIVNFCGDEKDIGDLVKVEILEARQHSLYGETT
ncbi:MAG TPA: tRNA (N6-isopentenyl adenosine(37)-C2)-methylthiotransferase MiaB [Nitrospirae bacterium]|nr:tRNA (N6-isopentenyl adenosine(37)-C2)-methylthiotransferase MiaB [Nitrospirota bacterium]